MIIFRENLFYDALFGLVYSRNINIEPENDGLVQMSFLFQECILRFHC